MEIDLTTKVARVLDREIRPGLQATGADIHLVGVDPGGIVMVRLQGSCGACPSTAMTFLMGIERQLREQVPEVAYLEVVPEA